MKSFRNVIQGIGEKISGDAQKLHEKIVSIDANELMVFCNDIFNV